MIKYFLIAFVVLVPGFLLAQPGVKSPVELKFKLPEGAKYEYTVTMGMNMNQSVMGQDIKIKSDNNYTYNFEVLKDSSNWKVVKATITRIKMNMDAMGKTMNADTDAPNADSSVSDPEIMKMFNVMKGSSFHFAINSKGDIENITGFKEMTDRLNAIKAQGSMQVFDENSFKQSTQQMFGGYPEKPVKIGDTWSKQVKMKNQGLDIISQNNYTLIAVNGTDALVKVQSKLSSAGSMPVPDAGVKTEITMTGNNTGDMHYFMPTGMPVKGTSLMNMDMTVKANGTDIPVKMEMNVGIASRKL